jgi:predicted RNA binding protein YcfA (HicA-like mRNA interferase family)
VAEDFIKFMKQACIGHSPKQVKLTCGVPCGQNKNKQSHMKYSEVEKKLSKQGCHFVKDGKKHPIWLSPITGKEFQLSHHRSEEVKYGTLKSISRDSGVKL